MRRRPGTSSSWVLWALLGFGGLEANDNGRPSSGSYTARRWTGVQLAGAQTIPVGGRWAQSSALLSPNGVPTLVVVSGKTAVSGQTVDSTPATSAALSLDLSQPIPNLSAPPWQPFPSTNAAPIAADASLIPLSSNEALLLGGDASSDPAIPLPTGFDSSWLLSLPDSSPSISAPAWSHETQSVWPSQPQRREGAYVASASNGTVTRAWVFGGLRPDGSETVFDEMWEFQTSSDSSNAVPAASTWAQWQGSTGPPGMYGGSAVLLSSSAGSDNSLPSIYLIGGTQSQNGAMSLADLSTAWVFQPGTALASGKWAKVKLANAPSDRRDHVAVALGDGRVWIHGGRNLDGTIVFEDAAVLDTGRNRWTAVAKGPAVWSHSAVLVGQTIVLAFGYGTTAPASSALSVYSPANNTWLSSYIPSYLTTIQNPKAGHGTASSAEESTPSASVATDPRASAAQPAAPTSATSGGAGQSQTGSGGDGSQTVAPPEWTAPGGVPADPTSSPGPLDSPSVSGNHGSGGTSSKSVIAGAVVGSLLGALALGVGGALAVKRHRDRSAYSRRAFTGDDFHGDSNGYGGLMSEHRIAAGYANSEAYNLNKALPTPKREFADPGAIGVLAALLTPKKRHAAAESPSRRRRFDMLDEEADEVWSPRKEGWTRFDDDDDDRGQDLSVPSMKGRGGLAVWDGFGGISRLAGTMRSSRSFLGDALGGFAGTPSALQHTAAIDSREWTDKNRDSAIASYGSVRRSTDGAGQPLTSAAAWDQCDARSDLPSSTDDGHVHSTLSHTDPSTSSHQTRSTGPTSVEVSPTKGARIARPFSPASNASLYGSSFATPLRSDGQGSHISRIPSQTSQMSGRLLTRSNTSWWSRLNLQKSQHGTALPTPTAAAAIRDPAPAPTMGVISESDPFLDPPAVIDGSSEGHEASYSGHADEQGRIDRLVVGIHDRSTSSNVSEATATSSVLEERFRNMDVVQRVQSGSVGGASSTESTPTMSSGPFGPASAVRDDPFSDRPHGMTATTSILPLLAKPAPARRLTRIQESERFTRDAETPLSPPTSGGPGSPRKRLAGPRPEPPSPSMPRSSSVKDIVASLEKRAAPASVKPPSRNKVVHGLVKKPLLYVANPDDT